ncbi:MAG: Glycine/sarcosine/betaine reductase component C chain 1 [uncultured Acidimicrobiales bacterium]|uniref:Glycine/sarcosine/betaine reductase component C chain 1 n=1 Tax=uncultured Acidimicrobiales bacterium TaxID=310071 RepID=A0A6J4JIN7_9ACTN|nr:MAG: Glycine/sarcosine/betaine reductase component C chain 1 [uncultured Acidimicrobiales bacterium]
MPDVVISAATQVLAHVPGLARHGSKPRRELPKSDEVAERFAASLRSFDEAAAYPAHQVWIGNLHPRDLPARPWSEKAGAPQRTGRFGEIMPEDEFFGLLAAVDDFGLFALSPELAERAVAALSAHPLAKAFDLDRIEKAVADVDAVAAEPKALRLTDGAVMRCGQADDESLAAHVLIDNLASKATATLALLHLLEGSGIDPTSVEYVLGCGEEAIGDRYQRGGGNLAKAVAEAAGLTEASGADVKNFCAAPIPALVMASALVGAGVFQRVAVIAGGSLAKLGMKFQGHLAKELPVMEDVLGGTAALVEADDGRSPRIRLDVVGRHRISAGGSAPQVMQALAVEPLVRHDIPMTDIDDFATELHNPEITEPQGSGNVPERNYRTIAALAAAKGDIARTDIAAFVTERGMPGFAPTQGHLASSLCYLPHALDRLTTGDARKVMLLAKGSLFLGRMCQLSDGMSVLLERNESEVRT